MSDELEYDVRDTEEYRAYAADIVAMFEKHRSLTRPEINKLLIKPRNDYWTTMALDLMHLIEHQQGQFIRYELYEPPAEKEKVYNGVAVHRKHGINITPPSERDRPDPSSFGMEINL